MAPFAFQSTGRFVAQIPRGFDTLAGAELEALGARRITPGPSALQWEADAAALFRIVYQARLITRVLAPLASFRCDSREALHRAGLKVDWPALFPVNRTFAVFANVSGNPALRHSKFAALCLKDAVADAFRRRCGRRPDVDALHPDVWLNLHIDGMRATVSLDVSGGSLHRRGYRRRSVDAPMQETLAAAMVTLSGWNGERPLYDPMCGSGTLLCEALMHACRVPAGFLRHASGLRRLPGFDRGLWEEVKQQADAAIRPLPPRLLAGSDVSPAAVDAAQTNCRLLPGGVHVNLLQKDFRRITELENHVILCNPPYGVRLQRGADLPAFYARLGDFLKQRCRGSEAYIYFGARELIKSVGLHPAWKRPLSNGGLDGRLVKYELH